MRLYHHLAILTQPDPPHEHQLYNKSQRFDCVPLQSKRHEHHKETVASVIHHQIVKSQSLRDFHTTESNSLKLEEHQRFSFTLTVRYSLRIL